MGASPDIIPSDLTLEIEQNLSPEKFVAAARAFFGYVQEVSDAVSPDGEKTKWVVKVREGSTLLGVAPTASIAPAILNAVYQRAATDLDSLIAGNLDTSAISEPALKHLKVLSELTDDKTDAPLPFRFWVKKVPKTVDHRIADLIRADWRVDYSDYGTVEGKLESIGDKDGKIRLQVRDAMFKQTIRCYVPEELLDQAFANFRKRVEIAGPIHYRKDGTPVSINVEKLMAFEDDTSLPTFEDVRGILGQHP